MKIISWSVNTALVFKTESSWGYFKPWIVHELGAFFPWPMNFFYFYSTSLLSWLALISHESHQNEFHDPLISLKAYFHDPRICFGSLLSWPISFPRKSLELISCPMNCNQTAFHGLTIHLFRRTKLMGHKYSLKSIYGYIEPVAHEFHW